jgi:hypothetical protein
MQATLYLLVLTVSSVVAIARNLVAPPGELPVWGTLPILTAAASVAVSTGMPARGARGSAA